MALRLRSSGRLLLQPIKWNFNCVQVHKELSPICKRSFHISDSAAAKARLKPYTPPIQTPKQTPSVGTTGSSQKGAVTLDVLFKEKKWPLVLSGFAAMAIGLYISLVVTSSLKAKPSCACTTACANPATAGPGGTPLPPTGRPAELSAATTPDEIRQTAEAFDKEQNFPELLIGITALRKRMAARARGHVLEVAVGTGRNLPFYDWTEVVAADEEQGRIQRERARILKVLEKHSWAGSKGVDIEGDKLAGRLDGEVVTFTGLDISGDMLLVARDRVRDAIPGLKAIMRKRRVEGMPEEFGTVVELLDGRVRLVMADAQNPLVAPPDVPGVPQSHDGKYDTIVQTFGLCSVTHPDQMLARMAASLRPDSGRILLLEHGRGWSNWINGRLDASAEKHYQRYGCWWNRDIEQTVREAAKTIPGLEIVSLERAGRLQFGTTLLIELKLNSGNSMKAGPATDK